MWVTRAARRVGVYFGVAQPVAETEVVVRPYVRSEARSAALMTVVAVALLLVGEAAHSGAAPLALLLAPLWAAGEYVWRVRDEVPDGWPPALPPHASLERAGARQIALRVALAAPGLALAVWLMERDELAAWMIPSIGLGTVLAQAAGVLQVRRWERRAGQQLLTARDGAKYARE